MILVNVFVFNKYKYITHLSDKKQETYQQEHNKYASEQDYRMIFFE